MVGGGVIAALQHGARFGGGDQIDAGSWPRTPPDHLADEIRRVVFLGT